LVASFRSTELREEGFAEAIKELEALAAGLAGAVADGMPRAERLRLASALAEFMRAVREAMDPLIYVPLPYAPRFDFNWLKRDAHRQTLIFYTDIWQIVLDEVRKLRRAVRLLDVGSGSGIGAQLLSLLLRGANGAAVEITANDFSEHYAPYARAHFDGITFLPGPAQNITEKYDIVLCSHLIEHFEDPFPFIEHLRSLATETLILYAPYRERPLSPGHAYSFDEPDLVRIGACSYRIVSSEGFRHQCFVAILEGEARFIRRVRGIVDRGGYAEAVELLTRSSTPRHGMARYLLGYSLCRLGRHAEAEPHLREAIDMGADPLHPNLMLAYCREAMGDSAGAADYLAKCDAIRSDHPSVVGARKMFAARAASRAKKPEQTAAEGAG
jgi:SAM-dependent methyltransferase